MKKRFNILDLFVILFVICLVAFLAVKFTTSSGIVSVGSDVAEYEIVVRDIKAVTANSIPESGALYDETGASMGTIVSKNVEKARVLLQTQDGSYDIVENKNKFDVTIKAKVTGVQKTEGFFFEGKKSFGVGSEVFVEAGNISFQGKILKMDVTEN